MEPMTLGSPGGSPATNPSPYLPSFLMGETQVPTTPRNTLSPNKGSRNISFASPIPHSPASAAFGEHHRFSSNTTPKPLFNNVNANYSGTQGPPTQGLFDSLRNERNLVETTPIRGIEAQSPLGFGTPTTQHANLSFVGGNHSFQQQNHQPHFNQQQNFQSHSAASYNDSSYLANNTSRCLTSPLGPLGTTPNSVGAGASYMLQCPTTPRYTEFWVTAYGFPPSAISTILQHFAQCGTIVDKVFPPQNGNWVHLKYASRLECDKALSYNEKILGNNIMIGVTQCKDKNIIDKENVCDNVQPCKVRPLAQTAYKSAQNDSAVVNNENLPQKSSGLMNKAMDLFFGW